jgi:WD40 repeat protein
MMEGLKLYKHYTQPHKNTITALAFSADATRLASGDAHGFVCVREFISKNDSILEYDFKKGVTAIAFSQEKNLIIVALIDTTVRTLNLVSKKEENYLK